ncbi:MAG: tyrosine-type recombinase/integrase [Nitrospirota bacterium]|nr:MAG: tyrosine-type recombinase/integrase [Nitrospirota bacterium]
MIANLTTEFIETKLTCPEGKSKIEIVHNDRSGLYVLVSRVSPGRGTYYLRYKNDAGKTTHRKLGRTDDISLAEAKAMVKKLRAEIALGSDPQAEVKEKRNEMTYHHYMSEFYFPYITPRRRNAKKYRELYDNKIKPAFGQTKVNAISKRSVQAFHSDLKQQGYSNAYCNRHLQLIKSSINVGINIMEIIDIANPAVGVPLFEEQGKDRCLNSEELARLIPVLIQADNQPARAIRFLLATGLRLSECLNCRWDHIDMENKIMFIPASSGKSKKHDSIPINEAAAQVLDECDRSTPYPFANITTKLPYISIKKRFKSLMRQADINDNDVTAHCLRRTAASIAINSGRTLAEVQKLLRHSSPIVTEKYYSRLDIRTLQNASDTISEQLLRAASGDK